MRIIILAIFLFTFDYYAFQGVKLASETWPTLLQTIIYTFYWAVPILAIGMVVTDLSTWNRNVVSIVRAFIFIAYFSKFVFVFILFGNDVLHAFKNGYNNITGNPNYDEGRSKFVAQMGIMLAAIPFVTLMYGVIRNRYRYKIFRETVEIENLPDSLEGLKIVQISDIHSGSFTETAPVRAAIELINQQAADLVFFTGDLVNSMAKEMDQFIDVFDKIESKLGVFSVLGNHDYGDYVRWESPEAKIANLEKLKSVHQEMGWDLLINENRILEIDNHKLAIIGVENYSADPRFQKYGNLQQAHYGTDDAKVKLLLSHDPTHWKDEVTTKYRDIDITFSGHTHGAQFGIEIPGWIKWSPIKYVYKQWAGLYQDEEQYLYVNRGLGFLAYPGRVGILPEITVLSLKRK